jgi:hypothetical protein
VVRSPFLLKRGSTFLHDSSSKSWSKRLFRFFLVTCLKKSLALARDPFFAVCVCDHFSFLGDRNRAARHHRFRGLRRALWRLHGAPQGAQLSLVKQTVGYLR